MVEWELGRSGRYAGFVRVMIFLGTGLLVVVFSGSFVPLLMHKKV